MKINILNIVRKKGNNGRWSMSEDSRKIFAVVLLVVLAVTIYIFKESSKNGSANPFKGCSILEENCADTSCAFYSSCGESGWQSCKIYDCGNDYGIFLVDKGGKAMSKREEKPDHKAIEAEKDACKGTMEILEQNCTDNKYQAKVRIVTKGECEIGDFFIFDENDQSLSNSFVRLNNNTYVITSDVCKKITNIIPASKNGMTLEF